MSRHFHPLRVRRVTPDTDDAVIVSFDVPAALADEFRFVQGQHLTLRRTVGDEEQRRSYSICAGLDDGELRVGIRKVPGGSFSNWLHDSLRAGDSIEAMAPEGRFLVPLEPGSARRYLCIAAGSGITPLLSIVKTVLAREPLSNVTLLYANRRQSSTMFLEELEDLKNRYLTRLVLHLVFSQQHTELPLYGGRLDEAGIGRFFSAGLLTAARIDHAFVCGPHGLDAAAEAALAAAGVPSERIHIERFGLPVGAGDTSARPVPHDGDAVQARIVVVHDGVRREIDFRAGHASILDAAAAAGLNVPFSCKSGVCCTCRARLLEGKVRMERNFALEKHEVAAGFVLACQAHPLTARVVLSFDDR